MKYVRIAIVVLCGSLLLSACSSSKKAHRSKNVSGTYSASSNGKACYYASDFDGKKTASGEIHRSNALTAAHKKLPFGTMVKVTNLQNGKSVVVRINDRGPFIAGRDIDLSQAAAKQIDMIRAGVVPVKMEY